MSTADDSRVRFSDLEGEEVAEYAPVSLMAIAALILGLLSAVALLHPLMNVLCIVAVAVSIQAIRKIRYGEIRQSGVMLAWIGLGAALFFSSWSVSREYVRQRIMYGHARQFAEQWLALVRDNKLFEAHELHLMPELRAARGRSLASHYAPRAKPDIEAIRADPRSGSADRAPEMMEMMEPSPHDKLQQLLDSPEGKRLVALGNQMSFEFESNYSLTTAGSIPESVQVIYLVRGADHSSDQFRLKLILERFVDSATADWRLAKFEVVE